MRHDQRPIGHGGEIKPISQKVKQSHTEDFVLEKTIFSNIFEKDIRRVFIYKKAERLAKALHLIAPAFAESASLRNRVDAIAIGLIDAAVVPLGATRAALSRELLALSSMLSIARTGGLLSVMNAELIAHEAHTLLQEIASYEEPRLAFDEAPTISNIAKNLSKTETHKTTSSPVRMPPVRKNIHTAVSSENQQIKDTNSHQGHIKDRHEAILSVIRNKKQASIKDISMLIRGVSEKTIQRELSALIESGIVSRQGERRWSTYSLI